MSQAILLLAHGAPQSQEEIPLFLSEVRGGRLFSSDFLDEVTRRYALLKNASPLHKITNSLASKVAAYTNTPVFVGMKYGTPSINEAVLRAHHSGITHLDVICLAPHYSDISIGGYHKKLLAALRNTPLTHHFVKSFHDATAFIHMWHILLQPLLRKDLLLVFTAHSLPARILDTGDPYPAQVHESAKLIAKSLGLSQDDYCIAWQSAAQTGEPWLSPTPLDIVEKSTRDLLIAPIGFMAEHLEILYDIDIDLSEKASKKGLRVTRSPLPNDSDLLLKLLSSLRRNAL